ncbi:MAG: DUF4301 family protein [Bacteroidetes bacterium]|nr:DUF4301 family protein [Bacteroidota bacterium]MBU1717642.1 DUF4301 family protein [Bacteroidota bacterium]
MNTSFSPDDIRQIAAMGATPELITFQVKQLSEGFPFVKLSDPATPESGIMVVNEEMLQHYASHFESMADDLKLCKFVPASGAATRMFKNLFSFLDAAKESEQKKAEALKDQSFNSVFWFIEHLQDFAFYDGLFETLASRGLSLDQLMAEKRYEVVIDALLSESGMNYGQVPKGMLSFHKYSNQKRTAFEEHLVEGALYGRQSGNVVNIHFTLSPEHIAGFNDLMNRVLPVYENEYGVKFNITHSIQKPSTDTIAVDMSNKPFREKDGKLHFRPGGHGALIENLNELNFDIIFIKNIDNIVPDRLKDYTTLYKKALAGYLCELLSTINEYRRQLMDACLLDAAALDDIAGFSQAYLNISISEAFAHCDHRGRADFLMNALNRPVRICGMVKNEGEPGGGPFWVMSADGSESLQIVESSQIDLSDPVQKEIFSRSTHFNPVDLVCSVKDHCGNKYNLPDFRDPETGFISKKSKDGRDLKALELPGLWNGAMANWITIFIEVPLITFNPVKVINDLVRKEHQA